MKGNISVFKETRWLPGTGCREERGTTTLVGGGGIPQQGGNWDNEGSHGKHCEKLENIQRHGQSKAKQIVKRTEVSRCYDRDPILRCKN